MSSGQKAAYEDDDEWDDFKRKYDILGTPWKVYSTEYYIARKLVEKDPTLNGLLLKLYIIQDTQIHKLMIAHTKERKELMDALSLVQKYKLD